MARFGIVDEKAAAAARAEAEVSPSFRGLDTISSSMSGISVSGQIRGRYLLFSKPSPGVSYLHGFVFGRRSAPPPWRVRLSGDPPSCSLQYLASP